jgi:uncharacterized protein
MASMLITSSLAQKHWCRSIGDQRNITAEMYSVDDRAMNKAEDLLSKLQEDLPRLRQEYRVKSLGLFGSYMRGDQKEDSDVDILVEFEEPIGLLRFIGLELQLTELLGTKVDLVMKAALKPGQGVSKVLCP